MPNGFVTFLKKAIAWIGDNILGHVIVEGAMGGFRKGAEGFGGKVGDAVVKKFTREDRFEAVILITRGMFFKDDPTYTEEDRAGMKRVNNFYARQDPADRDKFEQLAGNAWSVMKDGFGGCDPKQGSKTPPPTTTNYESPEVRFMRHWAELGKLGDDYIVLELEKLDRMSALDNVTKMISKGAGKTVSGLASFINGLNGVVEEKKS